MPYLRALERTGEVRSAAEDAGVDHSTAYARRRTHSDFAARWEAALEAHAAAKARDEGEEVQRLASTIASARNGSHPPTAGGEELSAARSQLKRVGHGRWSEAKEKAFFDELAATANVKRAAKAAGVSANAVYARRLKQPLFRAKWQAVLESGRAAIEMKLVEAANRTFDAEDMDTGDVDPTLGEVPPDGRVGPVVSVAEAIRIVQLHGSKTQVDALPDPYAQDAESMGSDDIQAVRDHILAKLRRMRQRDMPDMIARGWSYDEAYEQMVPPGWVRATPEGG